MKNKFILICTILFIVLLTCRVCAMDTSTEVRTVEVPEIQDSIQTDEEKNTDISHEHKWKEDAEKSKDSTCTENGFKYYTCEVCNETKKEDIKSSGHIFGKWETINGVKERKCEKCGFVEKETIAENKAASTPTPTPTPTPASGNKIVLHNTNIQNVESYNILENGILKPSGADKTVANKIIPAAGKRIIILPVLILLLVGYIAHVQYTKYKKL